MQYHLPIPVKFYQKNGKYRYDTGKTRTLIVGIRRRRRLRALDPARRPSPACLLLLLLPRLLLPPCQQPCCRAFGSHDGPVAARELGRHVRQGAHRASRRLARDAWRVSATFRRGAAAYGVASRLWEEARTHGCLPNLRWIIEIQGGFLHNFLRYAR